MINFIVFEDNLYFRNLVEESIDKFIDNNNIKYSKKFFTKESEDIYNDFHDNDNSTNVYFIDIYLEDNSNGLLIAKKIREKDSKAYIIIFTNHIEHTLRVFQYKLQVLDFIDKNEPNIENKVLNNLQYVLEHMENQKSLPKQEETLLIKQKDGYINVPLDSIYFFETFTDKRKITLYTIDKKIEFSDTMTSLMEKLNDSFYRCHRSYIVNVHHINNISTNKKDLHIVLTNDSKCLVSSKYLKGLLFLLNQV